MKIGELAKRTGLSASAIRFYESKGLLKSVGRQSNGYRDYPLDAAVILSIIVNAQQTGFTLDEIKAILPAQSDGWRHDELIATLNRKLQDIEAMELRLAQNKAHLRSLIALIESKPADMACADNAARVIDSVDLQPPRKGKQVP
ncbi:MerR family DNA-binding transcriptional regulator [Massilia sp. Mn16-1_5]|uniref:MerR family DNA-binding transcriptional regulator n=1 Tax=Massilia sp. Mn16-1_5 TaxID=2079199 RepID=UPI00109E5F5E|nr:MerR family DNA-binding transcriptional regulator [Massilia sp. Mn16-1_5]THC46100.1 MerR family transcriptional regulator [Massilia sp. Mn16-1_5]